MSGEREDANELALRGASAMTACFAILLGLVSPVAAASISAAATLGNATVEDIRARRERRKFTRLRQQVDHLEERVGNVEQEVLSHAKTIDLFLEVLERAIADDEEEKTPFYSAVMAWLLKESPTSAQVRVLSDAVRELSYIELCYFVHTTRTQGGRARDVLEKELPVGAVIARLESKGLRTGGIAVRGNPSALGESLLKYVQPTDVPPLEQRRR